MTDKIAVLIVI